MNGALTNGVNKPHINGVLPGFDVDAEVVKGPGRTNTQTNGLGHVPGGAEKLNGVKHVEDQDVAMRVLAKGICQMPPEIRHITQGYLRLSSLVERSAQDCWNGLIEVVQKVAEIPLPPLSGPAGLGNLRNGIVASPQGDQSKANLDKKEILLKFAQEQRATLIKLLVLSQWGRNADDVRKVIDLKVWLDEQRDTYTNVADATAFMKRDLALAQVPNPDLKTALEALSRGQVSSLPNLGYSPEKSLTPKRILKTLRHLNNILSARLNLHENLPFPLRSFRIHDGRVSFLVPTEFEIDLSIADEDPSTQFFFVDFRFKFEPCTSLAHQQLYDEIGNTVNVILASEGLQGCYEFLHDLALTYKINILHKQAIDLIRARWSENLRIELIRRTLVVQYWVNRPTTKSWIEIGVKHERRKDLTQGEPPRETRLAVRWLRERNEVHGADLDIDLQLLSIENILRQVVALHASSILEGLFDKLSVSPLYKDTDLNIDLSCSDFNPEDCRLDMQLTNKKVITITLEPVSGAIVLKPASASSGNVELELGRSKNLAEDAKRRLLLLRCHTAEQELLSNASSAGWDIVPIYKPSLAEAKSLFNDQSVRHCFLRQASWMPDFILAATFGLNDDRYWLVEPNTHVQSASATFLGSIDAKLESNEVYSHFEDLSAFVSGLITLRVNVSYLSELTIRTTMPEVASFQRGVALPTMSFQFQPAKLRHILNSSTTAAGWASEELDLQGSTYTGTAWIRETIIVGFCGLTPETSEAVIVAKGRSHASTRVLRYIQAAITGPMIGINPETGELSVRLSAIVGKATMSQLFDSLLQLETLIACTSVLLKHESLVLQKISPVQASFLYQHAPLMDLGLLIRFGTSTTPLQIEFIPEDSNPHCRIRSQLIDLLTSSTQPLHSNLSSLIPMLSFTLPLLSAFNELQSSRDSTTPQPITAPGVLGSPRLHILPRSSQMYGIQYYGPVSITGTSIDTRSYQQSAMLARFEVLPHDKKGRVEWVLRPAIDEYESYTHESYCSQALKDRLKSEVFDRTDPEQGWTGLSTGATCPIDEPAKLLKKVDETIRSWTREQFETSDATATGAATGMDGTTDTVQKPAPKVEQAVVASTSQVLPQIDDKAPEKRARLPQQKAAGASSAKQKSASNVKPPQKKPQEVITLD